MANILGKLKLTKYMEQNPPCSRGLKVVKRFNSPQDIWERSARFDHLLWMVIQVPDSHKAEDYQALWVDLAKALAPVWKAWAHSRAPDCELVISDAVSAAEGLISATLEPGSVVSDLAALGQAREAARAGNHANAASIVVRVALMALNAAIDPPNIDGHVAIANEIMAFIETSPDLLGDWATMKRMSDAVRNRFNPQLVSDAIEAAVGDG